MNTRLAILTLFVLLLVPFVYADSESLVLTEWYDRKENGTIDSLNFKNVFGSGEPSHVQIYLGGERLIIAQGDCKWYEDYKFCYVDQRFEPENEYGTIDYENDKEYYQIQLQIYKKESEIVDISVVHESDTSYPVIDEPFEITVTLTGSGGGVVFDVTHRDVIPDAFEVLSSSEATIFGNEVTWTGTIDKDIKKVFSYRLVPRAATNESINGTLMHGEDEFSFDYAMIVQDTTDVLVVSPEFTEIDVDLYDEIEFNFSVTNSLEEGTNEISAVLYADVPDQLLVRTTTLNHVNSKQFKDEISLAPEETIHHKIAVKANSAGPIPLNLRLVKGTNEVYNQDIVFVVPYEELRITHQSTDLAYALGETGFTSVTVWNPDKDITFKNLWFEANGTVTISSVDDERIESLPPGASEHIATVNFAIPQEMQEDGILELIAHYETESGLEIVRKRTVQLYGMPSDIGSQDDSSPVDDNDDTSDDIDVVTKNSSQGTGSEGSVIQDQEEESATSRVTERITDVVRDTMSDIPTPEVNLRNVIFLSGLVIILLFTLIYFIKKHMKLEIVETESDEGISSEEETGEHEESDDSEDHNAKRGKILEDVDVDDINFDDVLDELNESPPKKKLKPPKKK